MGADRRAAVALLVAVSLAALAAGCAPRKAALTLGASTPRPGTATASAHGLSIVVLPYGEAEERTTFGVALRPHGVTSAEVRFERTAGSAAALKVRRTGIRGRFSNGTVRNSLDPATVFERNRINPNSDGVIPRLLLFQQTPAAVLAGPAMEDQRRRVVFGSGAMATATIDDAHPVAAGFLFFDLAGIRDARLVAVEVEFEDATNAAIRTVEVGLPDATAPTGWRPDAGD